MYLVQLNKYFLKMVIHDYCGKKNNLKKCMPFPLANFGRFSSMDASHPFSCYCLSGKTVQSSFPVHKAAISSPPPSEIFPKRQNLWVRNHHGKLHMFSPLVCKNYFWLYGNEKVSFVKKMILFIIHFKGEMISSHPLQEDSLNGSAVKSYQAC